MSDIIFLFGCIIVIVAIFGGDRYRMHLRWKKREKSKDRYIIPNIINWDNINIDDEVFEICGIDSFGLKLKPRRDVTNTYIIVDKNDTHIKVLIKPLNPDYERYHTYDKNTFLKNYSIAKENEYQFMSQLPKL